MQLFFKGGGGGGAIRESRINKNELVASVYICIDAVIATCNTAPAVVVQTQGHFHQLHLHDEDTPAHCIPAQTVPLLQW